MKDPAGLRPAGQEIHLNPYQEVNPMSKSNRKRSARKPSTGFPLTRHPRGYWCKKVRGKLHYFGKIEADPKEPRWLTTVWGVGYRFEP